MDMIEKVLKASVIGTHQEARYQAPRKSFGVYGSGWLSLYHVRKKLEQLQ